MKLKNVFIIIILLSFLITIANVSANEDNNITNTLNNNEESNSDNNLEDFEDEENSVDELANQIEKAESTTITIPQDTHWNETKRTRPIEIHDYVIIDGQGHKFDGKGSNLTSLFSITGENVTLQNIVFENWVLPLKII